MSPQTHDTATPQSPPPQRSPWRHARVFLAAPLFFWFWATHDAECSGHGHLHGARCHCDTGYVPAPEDASACVPGRAAHISTECSGHGHLHGTRCHCDHGYVLDPAEPTRCTPE